MVDDGTPISFPATIERVCGGNPHAEGYTDNQGYFSLMLGQAPDVIADASETQGTGNRTGLPLPGVATSTSGSNNTGQTSRSLGMENRLTNCDLRASLGGYISKTINLTGRTSLDNPDVGIIMVHRMGASETGTTVTATTLKAPKEARKALQKGLELAKKNKPEEAIASLREAVKVDPDFAFAWFELGKLQVANEHTADGHESFEAAVKAEPRWPDPYMHLAVMGVKAHDWREVADDTDRVLRLNSFAYPQAYFLNAAANYNLHNVDVAEQSALAAEKDDVQHLYPEIQQLLGTIYVKRHRYAEAVEKFRAYLMLAPKAEDAAATRQQLAALENVLSHSSQVAEKNPQ
jgi:tetratricopeptide (TPR) repeat protein